MIALISRLFRIQSWKHYDLENVAEAALPHYTLKDTTLAGYRVPKDTVVVVNLMQVHLDPNCWENPSAFNPHRHIDADAGRRVCAGEALAKVELFLFLSWMLHKFTFLPKEEGSLPDLKGVSGFTRYPAPIKLALTSFSIKSIKPKRF
ncbi:hypothetical protein OS493_036641 [Desmophyllum pertusum]|uniref:Cytochrome P450 n=1 Tax=Desmophyllum pertusum TaxID=174260 RepID=A0A9X0CQF9_9CNID|nr:hypothetical protein OS493_036641 [Desmophyllum pertusum]